MPTTVTASNGQSFHLWQLPEDCCREPQDGIVFTTLDTTLAEGYASHVLFGLNTGIKSWRLQMSPGLSGTAVRAAWLTDPDGATVSTEQYLRNLYKKNRITGVPFVYSDPNNHGQYYLVDFLDDPLEMKRQRGINIYNTDIAFRQRRINGVTVFDMQAIRDPETKSFAQQWYVASNFSAGSWPQTPSGTALTATGDVAKVSAAQNGQDVVRLSGSAFTGYVSNANAAFVREVFIAVKFREATFTSGTALFNGATSTILIGTTAGTKWQNQGLGSTYEYRLNGVRYAESNQQAPMNEWGIVHLRYPTGWIPDGRRLGIAKADIGEVLVASSLLPVSDAREVTEYLAIKWGITLP